MLRMQRAAARACVLESTIVRNKQSSFANALGQDSTASVTPVVLWLSAPKAGRQLLPTALRGHFGMVSDSATGYDSTIKTYTGIQTLADCR